MPTGGGGWLLGLGVGVCRRDGGDGCSVCESTFADGAVGMVMTVLTLSVTLARATSPKGEALLNV